MIGIYPTRLSTIVSNEVSSDIRVKDGQILTRVRLVPISWWLGQCFRQGGVGFVDLFASRVCMEANWILDLIGLHADSVMDVR